MQHTKQSSVPTDHPECKRQNCVLRDVGLNGVVGCVMDSVRKEWADPMAKNYCEDPTCNKFVDLINSQFVAFKNAK